MLHLGGELLVAAEDFPSVVETDLCPIHQAVRFGQAVDRFGRKVVALKRDDVDAAGAGRVTLDEHVGGHVVQHAAQPAHEAVAADRRVVMHRHGARERSVIVHVHVSAEHRAIGHDDVIAKLAVVRDVAAGHDEVVIADGRNTLFLFGAAVDRRALANHVVVADDDLRVAAAVAEVLRIAADHHAWIDVVVLTDGDVPHQGDAVFEPGTASNAHVGADDAEGADLDVVVDFSFRVNRHVFGDVPSHDWSLRGP